MNQSPLCFFAMPFRPELNYFYLYVKSHLERRHAVRVERGDTQILTKAIVEKIRDQIVEADLIVGDVSGASPNVFYEVGLAHAFGKPVIFLTQDDPAAAPVDIRQFEFIRYNLAHHEDFLSKFDNAVQNVFAGKYQNLFERATELLKRFNAESGTSYPAASRKEFQARVMRGAQLQDLPADNDEQQLSAFLLPKIFEDATDIGMMQRVMDWVLGPK